MRDYAELVFDLRRHHCDAKEDDTQEVCEECAYDVIVADKSKFNGITDVCTCGLMHRAADAIEELLAAVPHWISVEERLPEDLQGALVLGKDGCVYAWTYEKDAPTDECWVDDYAEFHSIYDTTHWMPLPKAPKGAE